MEQDRQDRNEHSAEPGKQEREEPGELFDLGPPEREEEVRSRPTWRGLLIAVIAAVILSVGATLLLGGSYGFTREGARQGCGPGSECCPPADSRPAGG
ncbi:MAG: hypothetical protein A2X88_01310 [Deltaproteobacteria bacterium GWC2_65_14]|nr:MAG: hypothetical protein A2X88_01310 [Deltaproteobacteria bacterium GWC2_65_14]